MTDVLISCHCFPVLRFVDFNPEMMEVVKACLQPEPAKRLTALEVLALPYFDDIYEHLEGTEMQHDYDAAYAAAAEAKSPSARSLWTASSACTERRVMGGGAALRANAVAKGFLGAEAEDSPTDSAAGGGLCVSRLGRSRSGVVMLSSAPDITVAVSALASSPFESQAAIPPESEADCAGTAASATTAPLSVSALRSDSTRAGGGGGTLRRATTMGAPLAEDMHSVFSSTLDAQGRAVMQPLPTAAEAAESAAAAAATKQSAAAAGVRARIGCRVHFSGEGSNEALRLRMRASEESCMDLSQSPRNSLGGGHLVSKQLGVLSAFPVELQIEYHTPFQVY